MWSHDGFAYKHRRLSRSSVAIAAVQLLKRLRVSTEFIVPNGELFDLRAKIGSCG
jgi:hypothetical protein